MADEIVSTGGGTAHSGRVKLILNPPKPEEDGVAYKGHWVRAELDDEGNFTVRLFGSAQYGSRSLSDHVDLTDEGLAPVKDMLQQILDAYGDHAKVKAMSSAFEARTFALNQGETLKAAEAPKASE